MSNISIFYVDNDRGGYSCTANVPEGTTLRQFFEMQKPGKSANDYQLRVDNAEVGVNTTLQNNAKVTIAPKKFAGAFHHRVLRI